MPRLLIQSMATGRFLCPSVEDGQPTWVPSLREAGGGVVRDADAIVQLLSDNTDPDDMAIVIDLDRLGTANDYEVQP
jgi:hypothetical protein